MKKLFVYLLIIVSLALSGCVSEFAASASTPTPTPRPTSTPEITATSPPELPSPFDIELAFTNNSCGYDDAIFSYTFTIDGESLTILQTGGADITTTGSIDASGSFSTTGPVGPGVETYTGFATSDGATITVTGTATYEQSGSCTSVNDIFGEALVP